MKKDKTPNKKNEKVQVVDTLKSVDSTKKLHYFLAFIAFILFANTLGHLFNLDDTIVTNNHPLTSKGLSAIPEILTSPYYSDNMGYAYGYRPLVHISFAIQHELFGASPGAGHFINVLLYSLCVVLFYKLIVCWTNNENKLIAVIAALIFTVHPLHSEVVSSLKNRDEILAFLFIVWSGIHLWKYIKINKKKNLITTFILFSLAMLAKKSVFPIAIIFPIAAILLEKISWKQLLTISLPLTISAAFIGSELIFSRLLMIFFGSNGIILMVYYLKDLKLSRNIDESNKEQVATSIPLFVLTTCICALTFYFNEPFTLLLTLPLLFFTLRKNQLIGLFSLLTIGITLKCVDLGNNIEMPLLILALTGSVLVHQNGIKKIYSIIIAIIAISFYSYYSPSLGGMILLLVALIGVYLITHRKWIGLGFSVAVLISFLFVKESALIFPISLMTISLWSIIRTEKKLLMSIGIALPIIAFTLYSVLGTYKKETRIYNEHITLENLNSLNNIGNNKKQANAEENSVIKEGRQLQYSENTLVARHTGEERLATGLSTLGKYLQLHLYPKELSFYYGYAKIKTSDFKNLGVWLSLLAHIGLIILAFLQLKKRPLITIGVIWYLGCILLFSNWIELVAGMVGDRLTFTASAGFALLLGAIALWIKPTLSVKNPGIVGATIFLIIVGFTTRTFVRNRDWKDTMTLMTHDIKHLQSSAQANNMYAMTLMRTSIQDPNINEAQRLELRRLAINHFEQALKVCPDFFNVYCDLGRAQMIIKDYPKAIQNFKKAIEIEPTYLDTYNHLLEIYKTDENREGYSWAAKKLFEQVKEPRTYIIYSMSEMQLGNLQRAKQILLDGLEVFPNDEFITKNLALFQ